MAVGQPRRTCPQLVTFESNLEGRRTYQREKWGVMF